MTSSIFAAFSSLTMYGAVPHLKDLIHICLEQEAQGCSMTFYMCYVAQSTPTSYLTEQGRNPRGGGGAPTPQ